jgi:hypothetical protein
MIENGVIAEIIKTYKKHGWVLRRVLLSAKLKAQLTNHPIDLLNGAKTVASKVDAAWFSRPPTGGGIAWEIRYLGDPPFALLETIDESDPDIEDRLREVEERLRHSITAKISA